jgi:hypothetical protein
MGEVRNAWIVLVGNPEGNRSLLTPRRKVEDTAEIDLKKK